MPLVRLGPHESNPFPSLTRDGRRPAKPSERACRIFFNGNVTCATTRLVVDRARAIPPRSTHKSLIRKYVLWWTCGLSLEFCSCAIQLIQVLGDGRRPIALDRPL